jgi:hypothetical protein
MDFVKAKFEKHCPWLSAPIAFVLYWYGFSSPLASLKELVTATITAVAILIGFLSTMLSIFGTIKTRRIIRKIKEYGALGDLYGYFKYAIYSGFLTLVLSLLYLLKFSWGIEFFYIWLAVSMFFLIAAIRIVHFMLIIIEKLPTDPENNAPVPPPMEEPYGLPNDEDLYKG